MSQARSIADARRFRALHALPEQRALVLPNAWDALSAFLFSGAGARAIATASIPVAWSHGYPDGEKIGFDRLLTTVGEIARVTSLPVSVDLEAGFAEDPARVVEHVASLAEAGVAGVNLEDGAASVDLLVAKIVACKRDARTRHVFLNARTDVYLRGLVPPGAALAETLDRARRYAEAGADGLFVPRIVDPSAIRALVAAASLPVNVFAVPGPTGIADLEAAGVRRISVGPKLALAAYASALEGCQRLLRDGVLADPPASLDVVGLNQALGAVVA